MHQLLRRLWYLLRRRQLERDLNEEFAFHRAMKQRELEDRGFTLPDAALATRRAFGSIALARDQSRDVWIWPSLQDVRQDFRVALRLLARDRSFTIAAVLALALGVGVSNTLLIVVNAVCIRGLPIEAVHRVMYVSARDATNRDLSISYRDFEDLRSAGGAFSRVAAFMLGPAVVGDEGRAPDRVMGALVSAGAFELLHEAAALGRTFRTEDDRVGAPAVVILGDSVWRTRYAADPTAIGRTIRINGAPSTIIGIMGPRSRFPNNAELWLPLASMPGLAAGRRDVRTLGVVGRLKDDATVVQAANELNDVASRLARDFPDTNRGIRMDAVPINDRYNAKLSDPVWLAFMGAGALVLLIACANVANLLLMRAVHRAQEIAIRASLGATRSRVVRQLLVESVVLAAVGGVAGLGASLIGARLLSLSLTDGAPYWIHFTMDGRGFVALAVVCLSAALLFGLAPALHTSKADMHDRLQERGRAGTPGRRAQRWTTTFLVVEFGLTMVLMAALALGYRTTRLLQRADLVIDSSHLTTMWVSLPTVPYATPGRRLALQQQLSDRLREIPGVSSTAVATALPFQGAINRQFVIEGRPQAPGDTPSTVMTVSISGQYFESLGVSMLRGRPFDETDGTTGHETVIVNNAFAARHFGDSDPLGRRIRLIDPGAPMTAVWHTIVAIAPSVRQRAQGSGPDSVVYLPLRESPPATVAFLVRTVADRGSVAGSLREELRRLDPDLPMYRVRTMDQVIGEARINGQASNALITAITCIALGLAAVGLYAVIAHAVARRTHEIGVRMALGATASQVCALVLRHAMKQLSLGLLAGVVCAAAWQRLLGGANEPYRMTDPLVLAMAAAMIIVVASVACVWPARRATRLDPVAALRHE